MTTLPPYLRYAPKPKARKAYRAAFLTNEDATHIRQWHAAGFSLVSIAQAYDCTPENVWSIVHNRTHVVKPTHFVKPTRHAAAAEIPSLVDRWNAARAAMNDAAGSGRYAVADMYLNLMHEIEAEMGFTPIASEEMEKNQ